MNMTSKWYAVRSACALVLAGAIILGSMFTVAAAAVNTDTKTVMVEVRPEDTSVLKREELFEIYQGNGEFELFNVFKITLNNCGDIQTLLMSGGTVAEALEKVGIEPTENQIVVPSEKTSIIADMEISIYDAKEIKVTADGNTATALVPYGNVVDALNMAGFDVDDDDILSVSRNSVTDDLNEVTIQRVTYGEETLNKKIAYDSVNENSDEVELGETKVKTKGVNGEKLVTHECKYVDGKKVSEKVIDSKTLTEPVDEVILVGTKGAATNGGAGTFTDMYGNSVAYSQVLTGSGTAYTAPAGALTATGVPAYHGGVAVNPAIIPYGSKLYITSTDGSFVYGYATAVDTGGALWDGSAIVDCFYNTYGECVNFGRRDVNVYVIA